ncbi:hypothetical protein N3K66_001296 [Trichothecium roseum]|uniref:Uncharacterized protein n=1 Tax=Trichothecium roseum TaxID=47278 RepID=A0ACC0VE81_9HYPO|nr:hypothetical protein N3K66_001296 [Trichothecium roseum]
MASAGSWRSLLRPQAAAAAAAAPLPQIRAILPSASKSSFSTTSSLNKVIARAKKQDSREQKTTKDVVKKRKKANQPSVARKPGPGERKAYRKRIQLSNNSALEVKGLGALEPWTLADPESSCKMFALPDSVVDQLRALEAFKATQSWNLFRKPHVLVRKEVARFVADIEAAKDKKEALRAVLVGSKLSGKSMTVLQALAHALLNEWVVIHLPEGQDLTNGNTEYSPVNPDGNLIKFAQPNYTMRLMQNIYKVNKALFDAIELQKDHSRTTALVTGGRKVTLGDLMLSLKENDFAWPTFAAMWEELTLPGRPPIMFTLDGLSHVNKLSAYRDPSFKPVHSHDLTLIGTFFDALSGKTKLPNGGAIIAANSESNVQRHPSQDLAISQIEARQAGAEAPAPDPYERGYDDRVHSALRNARVLRLEGVDQEESRALMNYWAASGMMRKTVDNATVAQNWTLGGHGIVGEMERGALMTMRM